jgi:hypothetical protein
VDAAGIQRAGAAAALLEAKRRSRLRIRGDCLAGASGQDAERTLLTVAALFGQEALQFESFGERRQAPVIRPVADGASGDAEPEPPPDPNLHANITFLLDVRGLCCIHHREIAYLLDHPTTVG